MQESRLTDNRWNTYPLHVYAEISVFVNCAAIIPEAYKFKIWDVLDEIRDVLRVLAHMAGLVD
jgi:hypothetical protein